MENMSERAFNDYEEGHQGLPERPQAVERQAARHGCGESECDRDLAAQQPWHGDRARRR